MRKSLGARRTQVAGQFLSEAVLVSLLAFGLTLLLVQLLLTASEFLFGPALDLSSLYDPSFAIFLAGVTIITCFRRLQVHFLMCLSTGRSSSSGPL